MKSDKDTALLRLIQAIFGGNPKHERSLVSSEKVGDDNK